MNIIVCVSTIEGNENCNNKLHVHDFIQNLFTYYSKTELEDKKKETARQIITYAVSNVISLDDFQLSILKNAHTKYGCAIFPCLITKDKISLRSSPSPAQHISYANLRKEPLVLLNKNSYVVIGFQDTLQILIFVDKKLKQKFHRSIDGFQDVEIDTFFKDSLWHAYIYSYNNQVRDKILFSFFSDGSFVNHFLKDGFNKNKFCLTNTDLFYMTCGISDSDSKNPKYLVDLRSSANKEPLKSFSVPLNQFNPNIAMNIVAINQKQPTIIWANKHLYMQHLDEETVYDLGALNFSRIFKISFSNDGMIAWIEGKINKDDSYVSIQAWNLLTKKEVRDWQSCKLVNSYVFSPNGVLALGLYDMQQEKKLFLCDAFKGSVLAQFNVNKTITDYFFKSNQEISLHFGNEGTATIDITLLQMTNWIASKRPFADAITYLRKNQNQLLQDTLERPSQQHVFEL
jgi:hypothetical protein